MPAKRWLQLSIFILLASLDNAAAGVLPPLYAIISRDLQVSEAWLGAITAVFITITATSAILWGYQSDRQLKRKPFLLIGTAIWSIAMFATGAAPNFAIFLTCQLITAVGVGAVSSLGFSVISDLIPAHRRGFALSLWSISQGLGAAFGALLASTVGAFHWQTPFFTIAALGLFFGVIYLFVPEPKRGEAEPELQPLFAVGKTYNKQIGHTAIKQIWQQPSTRWLLIQAFFFSFSFGVSVWIPRWAIAKVQAQGFDLEAATIIGNAIVLLFSIGSLASIYTGYIGDRLEAQNAKRRPYFAMFGSALSAPFFILLFFMPLQGIPQLPENTLIAYIGWVTQSFIETPILILAFGLATIGNVLLATDLPNWAAMITSLNLPENRATAIGISRFIRAIANALSIALGGWLFQQLQKSYTETNAFAIGLAIFQGLVILASICYWFVAKHINQDLQEIRRQLMETAVSHQ